MEKEIAALFDEHESPTHVDKQSLRDQMAPIARVANDASQQVLKYRALLTEIELAEHDETLGIVFEHLHQTLGSAEREATAFAQAGRALAFAFTQLDQKLVTARADVTRKLAAEPATIDGAAAAS